MPADFVLLMGNMVPGCSQNGLFLDFFFFESGENFVSGYFLVLGYVSR
jgi:hypothetical protein